MMHDNLIFSDKINYNLDFILLIYIDANFRFWILPALFFGRVSATKIRFGFLCLARPHAFQPSLIRLEIMEGFGI